MTWQEVKEQFPNAWDTLVDQIFIDDSVDWEHAEAYAAYRNTFSKDENGVLWCEDNTPTDAIFWDEAIGWRNQDGEGDDVVLVKVRA